MVVFICNRKTDERAFGPYTSVSSARSALTQRRLQAADYYIADENWRVREQGRPNLIDLNRFGLTPIQDHFLHVSVRNDQVDAEALMVSFTLNETKGRQDRQEAGRRIGRYLKEFYPNLTSDDITRLSGEINAVYNPLGIRFATTRAEIRWVYEHCGSHCGSCMTHPISHYNGRLRTMNVHPAEAYAGPDLAIAYQVNNHGEVTGRAICWPEKKIYGRIYSSDQSRFRQALEDAGFRNGNMLGARMTPISVEEVDNVIYFAMPYVDGHDQYVTYSEGVFKIGQSSRWDGIVTHTGTGGIVSITLYRDVVTGEIIHNTGDVFSIRHPYSRETLYTRATTLDANIDAGKILYLDGLHYWMGGDESHYVTVATDGKKIPLRAIGGAYIRCQHDGKVYPREKTIHGYYIEEFLKNYGVCEVSLSVLPRSKMVWMEHGAWWAKHYFDVHGVTIDGRNYSKFLEREVA